MGEKGERGRRPKSKRQGRYLGPDAAGLHSEDSRGPREGFDHGNGRSRGRTSGTPEKIIIMNEKALRVQLFFKMYLESEFEVMFLN